MSNNVKINIILPFKPKYPSGGFRIVFQYANHLAERGYSVHLYFPLNISYLKYRLPLIPRWIQSKMNLIPMWFKLHPSITTSTINSISNRSINDADIVIATWWSAVLEMGKLKPSKGEKINLIQGYENWLGHEDKLWESYKIEGVTNVVVASYLKEVVDNISGKPSVVIPNSISNEAFYITTPIEKRFPKSVCMMYSEDENKGFRYGLEALLILKERYPDMTADLFGIYDKPVDLPDWINYYKNPDSMSTVYNKSAIFVGNSLNEGMSLTPMEAMMCGCAVVVSDIKGYAEYSTDQETALLYRVKDSKMLAEKISYLFDNNEERINLAERGRKNIGQYTWDIATDKLESLIHSLLKKD